MSDAHGDDRDDQPGLVSTRRALGAAVLAATGVAGWLWQARGFLPLHGLAQQLILFLALSTVGMFVAVCLARTRRAAKLWSCAISGGLGLALFSALAVVAGPDNRATPVGPPPAPAPPTVAASIAASIAAAAMAAAGPIAGVRWLRRLRGPARLRRPPQHRRPPHRGQSRHRRPG